MPPRPPRRPWFFLALALLFMALAVLGFSRSFLVPLASGDFTRGTRVVVHGVLLFAWFSLLLAQAALAATRRMAWHRRLGWVGAALVVPIFLSGVHVSAVVAAPAGGGPIGAGQLSVLAGATFTFALFLVLATAAVLVRRAPQAHKRLLVFATLLLLGAAVARIPWLAAYAEWVDLGVLGLVIAHDLVRLRRLHLATLLAGGAFLFDAYAVPPLKRTPEAQALARQLLVAMDLVPPG